MIARVTSGKQGFVNYMITGQNKHSQYTRDEKDDRLVIHGDLELFQDMETFLTKEKNYKDNYLHITLSFSKDDEELLNAQPYDQQQEIYNDLVNKYIEFYTSGYDSNNIVCYAELHRPTIKHEFNAKLDKQVERFSHIHLAISLYDCVNDVKLSTPFTRTTHFQEILQNICNDKYGFTRPQNVNRTEKNFKHSAKDVRAGFVEKLSKIEFQSYEDLIEQFKKFNFEFKEVKTKNNHYLKVFYRNEKGNKHSINLRGKGFENFQKILNTHEYVKPCVPSGTQEAEQELKNFYELRKSFVMKRQKKTTPPEATQNDEVNTVRPYQNILVYDNYNKDLDYDLTGFSFDKSKNTFTHKEKNVFVADKGNLLTCNSKNYSDSIDLMIQLAITKNWDLHNLVITGSPEFINMFNLKLAQFLEVEDVQHAINEDIKDSEITLSKVYPVHTQIYDSNYKHLLTQFKNKLDVNYVLNYAISNNLIDCSKYKIIDNKINNQTNKKKPQNCLDFLQKECKLSYDDTFKILDDLLKIQELEQESDNSLIKNTLL